MPRTLSLASYQALILAILTSVSGTAAEAGGPDKIKFRGAVIASPETIIATRDIARIAVPLAVRPTDGLEAQSRLPGRDPAVHFFVRAVGTVTSAPGGAIVATLQREIEILPPFSLVQLPVGGGEGTKAFIATQVDLAFDGRQEGATCINSGRYTVAVVAEFRREREIRPGVKVKEVDCAGPGVPRTLRIDPEAFVHLRCGPAAHGPL